MYISNGYVYGGTPSSMVKITSVRVIEDKMLLLRFASDEERLFDASILEGEGYLPLNDPEIFRQAYVDGGVVTWLDGAVDCSPQYMYEHSVPYSKSQIA